MVKRSLDVFLSAVLLLLTLPVLLLSALMIRLTSPGPILFRQMRMGLDFRPFAILKFRTMAHAEAGLAFTLGPDPRITPFGKWLRRSKIDEFPQLWNVLRGEMSLVGPRPVLPELIREFQVEYAHLLKVRPGLTDPASLKYSQEARLIGRVAERDRMPFFKHVVTPDKLRISLRYSEEATVWSDLGTIFMTGLVCCSPSLSRLYGVPLDPNEWVRQDIADRPLSMAHQPEHFLEFEQFKAVQQFDELAQFEQFEQAEHFEELEQAALIAADRVYEPALQMQTAPDGSLFDHGLIEIEAAIEASNEELSRVPYLPWIAFPNLDSAAQSTNRVSEGGPSRL